MRQRFSPATIAALAATLVVLGIVGWTTGWLVADAEAGRRGEVTPTPSDTPPSPAGSNSPSPSPSVSIEPSGPPEPTPTRTDAFAMPDLVGMDFREARQEASAARLGVHIVFGRTDGHDGKVVATNPEPDILVYPGLTIFLYVAGDPPTLNVPDVTDQPCREGRNTLLDAGLLIEGYPSGEKGTVRRTDPVAGTEVTWNTRVKVYCAETGSPGAYQG